MSKNVLRASFPQHAARVCLAGRSVVCLFLVSCCMRFVDCAMLWTSPCNFQFLHRMFVVCRKNIRSLHQPCIHSRLHTRRRAPVLGHPDFLSCDNPVHLRTVVLPGRYSLSERESPSQASQQPVAKARSSGDILAVVWETHLPS
jgi:hypothetical protein